jgi:primosomal protein N' (replication factor Y)
VAECWIAKVYVDKAVYHFDKPFSYFVPQEMAKTLKRGCRVVVPFGNGNRRRQGIVVEVVQQEQPEKQLKPVFLQIDREPVFSEEMFRIAHFMVVNTFCTYYDAVKTILPGGIQMMVSQSYTLTRQYTEEELGDFSYEQRNLIRFLQQAKSQKELDLYLLENKAAKKQQVVDSLITMGVIAVTDQMKQKVSDKTVSLYRLTETYLSGELDLKFTPKQREVVEFLEQVVTATPKEVAYFCAVGESVGKTLLKKGVLEVVTKEVYRIPDAEKKFEERLDEMILSKEQNRVYEEIVHLLDQHTAQVGLLYGVTGSGKTQVFIKLIERVIQNGQQAFMLVPEISLTPQMVERFKSLFGDSVAVMHSSLSLGERLDEFKRIRDGKASIVVGTRSAIFAPFENIGLIIMDEEGESSYKSDSSPRYHAREIAKFRCVEHNAVLLLASATPSIESWYKAQKGVYHLFTLRERYANARLPEVYLVDLKAEEKSGNRSSISQMLQKEIQKNLDQKEQTILLMNRRGYHTAAQCMECGEVMKCPHCDAALTYHRDNGYMMCHYCGYAVLKPSVCPNCSSGHIRLSGMGTQKIEDELRMLYPAARVLRMDADTTYSRYAYTEKFDAFRKGEYDILIGTQMIAKGLDFPNVTLVGVLNADSGLYAPDFRGVEREFSLITQVVGRSGRAEKLGRAYIQTYVPENPVIQFAAKQDFESFYEDEIVCRKALLYPPFCDMCMICFSGLNVDRVHVAAQCFTSILKQQGKLSEEKISFQAMGPVKAAMYKMNGKFRERIMIKCKFNGSFKRYLKHCLEISSKEKAFHSVSVTVDINGDANG